MPKIETALINEVTGDNLKELALDGAEIALDSFLNEEVLKEIPFFSILYKGFKVAFGIREGIFAKKIFKFLTELKDIPQEKRKEFIKKLEANHEYQHKVGEKLLIIIEQLDDIDKPTIIGKLLKAAINENITYEEFLRLSSIIQKAFLPDLLKLKNRKGINSITQEHFNSLGIMSLKLERDEITLRFSSDKELLPIMKYELNRLGDKLIEFGLK